MSAPLAVPREATAEPEHFRNAAKRRWWNWDARRVGFPRQADRLRRNDRHAGPVAVRSADSLLLWDRGFFSDCGWKTALDRGVQLLCRVKKNLILKPIQPLADGSCLAKISPKAYDREKDRKGIVVRVIRYKLDDPQRTGHDEEHILLTSLLDAEQVPATELICLYHERWEEELTFDEQKTHQDPRRASKPANLRSETPAGVVQELYALSLAHFVIRTMMFDAAEHADLSTRTGSRSPAVFRS